MNLKDHIRSIPDFPKPGILFYDISTLLAHPKAWHETIEQMAAAVKKYQPEVLAGIESRGFLLAAPLALALGTGFVMLRKQGKWAELADALRAHVEVEPFTAHKVDLLLGLGDLQESQLASTAKAIEAYQAAADLEPRRAALAADRYRRRRRCRGTRASADPGARGDPIDLPHARRSDRPRARLHWRRSRR
jgi:hypothetical protein